ncbi:hypothetical protein NBH20_01335 [Rhizobium sp. S153]|uniref:Uncharacterized protein n=1 Tax=Ciceribacter sichuanensis TaxID=2949647 RepID=A0ABT0V1Y6_9HYPH|nr:hypothetical protein [Ciceribacter sp. S153]MCM2399784.1 hypothetical protein [Ciceribacter sp. S153]
MDDDSRKFVERPMLGGHSNTLNIIPGHVTLLAECRSCGHRRELDRELLNAYAHTATLGQIEARLRCACGEKNTRLMTGYWVSAPPAGNNS